MPEIPSSKPNDAVSIGLPTYNRKGALKEAIDSALRQSHRNIELIISDDCSSDGTQELCEEYARSDSRVKYVRQDPNLGLAGNFNYVLNTATSDYFMWLSDDDWMDEDYVEKCLTELMKHPDYGVVCGVSKFYRGGTFERDGEKVQLTDDNPIRRVLKMYATFEMGCYYYGVYKRPLLGGGYAAKRTVGEDIFVIASALSQAKGATIEGTHCHRSSAGATDPKKIAKFYGLRSSSYWMIDYKMATGAAASIMHHEAYTGMPVAQEAPVLNSGFHVILVIPCASPNLEPGSMRARQIASHRGRLGMAKFKTQLR